MQHALNHRIQPTTREPADRRMKAPVKALLPVLIGLLALSSEAVGGSPESIIGQQLAQHCLANTDTMMISINYAQAEKLDREMGRKATARTTFSGDPRNGLPVCTLDLRQTQPS